MNFSKQIFLAYLFFFGCLTINVHATTYHYLSHSDLIGQMAGEDLFWQTGDDFAAPVFNPNGHASGFINFTDPNDPRGSIDSFGSIGGSFEVNGTTVTSYDVIGEISTADLSIISTPLTEALNPNLPSTFTVGPNNLATSLFNLNVTSIFGIASFTLTSDYAYFHKGDDFNSIFAGNQILLDQINFLVQFLPSNWETFFLGIENYQFHGTQLFGQQGAVFYTTVPEPSTLILMGLGIFGLGLARRK